MRKGAVSIGIRARLENELDRRRLHGLQNGERFKNILPEAFNADGFDEQSGALFASHGTSKAFGSAENVMVITGPCLVPCSDVKEVVEIARRRLGGQLNDVEYIKLLERVLERQPTLQNVANIGVSVDNTHDSKRHILCIMETYEVALLMANNEKALFERNRDTLLGMAVRTAKRTEDMIKRFRARRGIKSDITFFYTHDDVNDALMKGLIDRMTREGVKPRAGSYFTPDTWKDISKTRIEMTYTIPFQRKVMQFLKGNFDMVAICENYKHFFQIFDGTFILPLEMFGAGSSRWIGLMPLPSLENGREMDVAAPFYLGYESQRIRGQMEEMTTENALYALGAYLMALLPSRELQKRGTKLLLDTIFNSSKRYLDENKLKSDLIERIMTEVNRLKVPAAGAS